MRLARLSRWELRVPPLRARRVDLHDGLEHPRNTAPVMRRAAMRPGA